MLCQALCAFREPFNGAFVEALCSGAMVDVCPTLWIGKLAGAGHIKCPEGLGSPRGA